MPPFSLSSRFLVLSALVAFEMSGPGTSGDPSGPPVLPAPDVVRRVSAPSPRPSDVPAAGVELTTAVVELPIQEVFKRPIGPRGLEYSEFAKSLEGRRVRVLGYMVRQTAPLPFGLLLTAHPAQLHEREYGLADDLPAGTVHVLYPKGPVPVIPHVRRPVLVEGILELGPVEQADGRLSHVRLRCLAPWQAHISPVPAEL